MESLHFPETCTNEFISTQICLRMKYIICVKQHVKIVRQINKSVLAKVTVYQVELTKAMQ